jgi:FtsZ-binding cell division protein ZapB
MSEETFTLDSLIESNNILQDEVTKLRNSNRILRTVHRALRAANDSLRRQVEQAQFNDETFKQFCNGEFDAAVVAPEGESALLGPEGQADSIV